ncbi:MAG: hypothetical protein ABEL51_12900 [Salinibacter sp.]
MPDPSAEVEGAPVPLAVFFFPPAPVWDCFPFPEALFPVDWEEDSPPWPTAPFAAPFCDDEPAFASPLPSAPLQLVPDFEVLVAAPAPLDRPPPEVELDDSAVLLDDFPLACAFVPEVDAPLPPPFVSAACEEDAEPDAGSSPTTDAPNGADPSPFDAWVDSPPSVRIGPVDCGRDRTGRSPPPRGVTFIVSAPCPPRTFLAPTRTFANGREPPSPDVRTASETVADAASVGKDSAEDCMGRKRATGE